MIGALSHRHLVEGEVEFEDVDARFAEKAEIAALDVMSDEIVQAIGSDAASGGDARDLEVSVVGRDVGIEAGGGGRDHIDGNGLAGVLCGELVDIGLHSLWELRVGLREVGAAGRSGIVAVACR